MLFKANVFTASFIFALLSFSFGQAMAAGALAIDTNQCSSWGWGVNYPNTAQASQRALNDCGGSCQVVLQFNSGCGAYATDQANSSTAYGWGTASSGGAAQSRAISECQSRGGSSCMIRAWGCN